MKTRLIAPIVFSAAVLTTAYAQSQMTTGFDGQTNPAPVASKTVYENNQYQNADSDIFEFGITFAFDSFLENKIAGTTVEANEFYHHIGANLGIVMRWQLNHWMSFLTGLSAIYHHGQYEMTCRGGGTINYHNIMAEIPLQLRYAISFNRTRVRPFASISTNIVKPIYMWDEYDGAYAIQDWEFLEYLGFGVELNRHVAIQWQPLLYSIRTNAPEKWAPYDGGIDSWRMTFEFTW